tara:strand:+ start:1261 stop:2289 length:1029 start_codon:yes stop_codon:yes gene_type:complete
MKISKAQAKKLLYEGFESNESGEVRFVASGLEDLLSQLLNQMKKLDLSIDYLSAAFTGEDPLNIGQRQAVYGRAAGVRGNPAALAKEALKKINVSKLVKEALEADTASEEEWKPIPPEELHDALSASIYDLYKYVNGIRPRWIKFDEMSVEELEEMHHSLTAELEQQAQDEEARSYKPDYDPSEYTRGLEDRYISDHDAYEAEQELMMTPEKGEEFPRTQGMGAQRSHAATKASSRPRKPVTRRAKKISEQLEEIIREELRNIREGNLGMVLPVGDFSDLSDEELIDRLEAEGAEDMAQIGFTGKGKRELENREEVIEFLSTQDPSSLMENGTKAPSQKQKG